MVKSPDSAGYGFISGNFLVLRCIILRPSDALKLKRNAAREATRRFRAHNLRVFGPVGHGDRHDRPHSVRRELS